MYFCPRRLFVFVFLANSAEPDEKPPYAAFHLGHHCLSTNQFIGIHNEKKRPQYKENSLLKHM